MVVVILFILRVRVAKMGRARQGLRAGRIGGRFDGGVPDLPMLLTAELSSQANFYRPGLVGGVSGRADGRNT